MLDLLLRSEPLNYWTISKRIGKKYGTVHPRIMDLYRQRILGKKGEKPGAKNRQPTVPLEDLKRHWVNGARVLYIGKAGGRSSKQSLRDRLHTYMDFGRGKPVAHWGGRYIWQLANVRDLRICWKITSGEEDPAIVESELIKEFKTKYGQRPFASARDPSPAPFNSQPSAGSQKNS